MKRVWPFLEQARGVFRVGVRVSIVWIVSLSLTRNDEDNTHSRLGNVQGNQQDLTNKERHFRDAISLLCF